MKKFILFFMAAGLYGQTYKGNTFSVVPTAPGTPGGATVGKVIYQDLHGNYISTISPNTLGADYTITWPKPTGTAGCWLDNGAGVTSIIPCGSSFTTTPASPGECVISALGGFQWSPEFCENAITRGMVGAWDLVTMPDSTHFADVSGYGNTLAINGGITPQSYGVDGDGITGTYLEATWSNLNPSPYTSGQNLATNGCFSSGAATHNGCLTTPSLTGWTTAGTVSATTATLTEADGSSFTGTPVAELSVAASTLTQVIAVQPNTIYSYGYWTVGSGSGAGIGFTINAKAPDISGTVNGSGGTITFQTGVNDYSSYNRFSLLQVGQPITINSSACTVAALISDGSFTASGSGCTGTLTGVTYSATGLTAPLLPISPGTGTTTWAFESAMFATPDGCTELQVVFTSNPDSSAGYVTEFTLTQAVPITMGVLLRRNGVITGSRQYFITQDLDLQDSGAAGIQPSRLFEVDFDNTTGNVVAYANVQQGNSAYDAFFSGGFAPAQGDWHYIVVSWYPVPSKTTIPNQGVTTYPYYRLGGAMYIDGVLNATYTFPTPSQPIFPDRGVAPFRLFATDSTGNQHNFLGSIAFSHVNRAQWSAQDAYDAAGCMYALLVARGQTPAWSGVPYCPRGGVNLVSGTGVSILNGSINIGQPVGQIDSPIFSGQTLNGPQVISYGTAASSGAFNSLSWSRTDGNVVGVLGHTGTPYNYVYAGAGDSSHPFNLVTNATSSNVGGDIGLSVFGHQFYNEYGGSGTTFHQGFWGRGDGNVRGFLGYDGPNNSIVIGTETDTPVEIVDDAGTSGTGNLDMTCGGSGNHGNCTMGNNLTVPGTLSVTGVTTVHNLDPAADNTYEIGSTNGGTGAIVWPYVVRGNALHSQKWELPYVTGGIDHGTACSFQPTSVANGSLGCTGIFNLGGLTSATSSLYSATSVSSANPALSGPAWQAHAPGDFIAQDVTARYVFNSAGDVPQTGTATISGTTFTATSGTVDLSWVGGQILICSGTCTASNGTLYPVTGYTDQTHLTLGSAPGGGSYSYSYQANAFQTSTGTMYITGTGFGYFQNAVVTDGFTSLGSANLAGTATPSGTSVVWVSGSLFDPSMQGGVITFIVSGTPTPYVIASVQSPTRLTLASSAGTPGTQNFTYYGDAVRALAAGVQVAAIHNNGNGYFTNPSTAVGYAVDAYNFSAAGGSAIRGTASGGAGAAVAGIGNGAIGVFGNGGTGGTGGAFTASGGLGLSVTGGASIGGGLSLSTPLAHTYVAATTVTPGTYTNATITVQADGSLTAASSGSLSGVVSGTAQFVVGGGTSSATVGSGLTSSAHCTATPDSGTTPTEFVGRGAISGGSVTFYDSNPTSTAYFDWVCTP